MHPRAGPSSRRRDVGGGHITAWITVSVYDRRRDRVPLLWRLSSPRRPRRPCAAVLVQLASLPGSRSLRTAALREISFSWRRTRASARSTAHLEGYRLRKNTLLSCSRSLKWSVSKSGGSCRLTRVCGVSIGVCSTAPVPRTALTLIIATPRAAITAPMTTRVVLLGMIASIHSRRSD